ncbi:hypothetical protein ACEYYB_02205 [Paracoccus sp. p4-l81]|uniref:hypothetical protein n=1 Tax=Paracoccus sp. p4-l81 TaxID=3342806 RepID=UPI0035B897E0
MRAAALILVSLLIPLALILGLILPPGQGRPLMVMIATALAANAAMQAVASLAQRRPLPGTLTGLVLMLPTAIWLLAAIPQAPAAKMIWGAAGVAATPLVLLPIWWLAAALSRHLGLNPDGSTGTTDPCRPGARRR